MDKILRDLITRLDNVGSSQTGNKKVTPKLTDYPNNSTN